MRLQKRIYENEQTDNCQILNTNPKIENIIKTEAKQNDNINNNNIINENQTKNRNINNYNSLSNIFLKENKKSNNIKIRKQNNKKEILNKSANNSKNKLRNKIININKKNKIPKDEYDFIIPKKYLNKDYKLIRSIKDNEKITNTYTNDKKEIIYKNGKQKEI